MPARRSTFTDQPVNYAAVGATIRDDLLFYPPKGYKPMVDEFRLGSGDARFEAAVTSLMTWGVQRGAGIEVRDIDPGTGEHYAGIRFNPDGTPDRMQEHRGTEAVFTDDGTPYITNGMTAVLHLRLGLGRVNAPVRVVYVVDDQNRVGFAYGTLHGHPQSGEQAFLVEHRGDDSVWFGLRSFWRPAGVRSRLAAPLLASQQRGYVKRYLHALHPARGA